MKNIFLFCLSLLTIVSYGQSTDAQLTTQANVIRNETQPNGNTKTRIANMYQAIIDSKLSRASDIGALSRTNDTNVTLTLGGTPTLSLLKPVSMTLGWTGQLSLSRGGTGTTAGSAFQVPAINSGATAYNYGNIWFNPSNNTLYGGDTGMTAPGGSQTITWGDDLINNGSFGSAMFGEAGEIATGVGSALYVSENGYIEAYGGKAMGRGVAVRSGGDYSFIGGWYEPSSTSGKTNFKAPQITGHASFGWYETNASQTINHGINSSNSVILGGLNPNIPSTSPRNVILAGNAIKARHGESDQVYIANLNIGTKPNKLDTAIQVLVRAALDTGRIGYRLASSFLPSVSSPLLLSGSNISIGTASDLQPGIVSTGTQTFGGQKTFATNIIGNADMRLAPGASSFSAYAINYGGSDVATYISTYRNISPGSNLFGLGAEAYRTYIYTLGSSCTGMVIGTYVDQPLYFGRNNATVSHLTNAGFAYEADNSASWSDRNVPDKHYVDSLSNPSVAANRSRKSYKRLWTDFTTGSGSYSDDIFIAGGYIDAVAQVTIKIVGVKSDGSEGYTATKVAAFRRDGTATIVEIGTETTVSEIRDDTDAISSIQVVSGQVNVSVDTGDGDSYHWTIWADIDITEL